MILCWKSGDSGIDFRLPIPPPADKCRLISKILNLKLSRHKSWLEERTPELHKRNKKRSSRGQPTAEPWAIYKRLNDRR
jgi:hypothetical protein